MILEAPDFSVALACLAAALTVIFVVLGGLMSYFKRSNMPPGPTGLPVFGNTIQFGDWPFKTWFKWSKDYGPILTVRGGADDWIILNSFESTKQVILFKSSETDPPLAFLFIMFKVVNSQ